MTLVVDLPALMMTVQDRGRSGYQRFGMPESGPMDWWAFWAANILVGNSPCCACLEVGLSDAAMHVETDTLMALCGAGFKLTINEKALPLWMAFKVRRGDSIRLEKTSDGSWVYLAVSGGFLSPEWMGSRSYYLRAGLGRPFSIGDRLACSPQAESASRLAGSTIPPDSRPDYREHPHVRVVLGLHQFRFTGESLQAFLNSDYLLSAQSDRMGYRLSGPALGHVQGADLVSQGMGLGEVQVPADGQPIIMMPDHPTTGGYTCIGTVARVDLPLLAQARFGVSQIRFLPIEVGEAQKALKEAYRLLGSADLREEEPWLKL
jgi:antagonist of KipI